MASSQQGCPAGLKRQVFISHTGQDEPGVTFAASILRPALQAAGLDVFIDYQNLELGCDWQAKLVEAAATSAVFVVVLSCSFGERFWCLRELDIALHGHPEYPRGDSRPHIIPVYIDPPNSINKLSKEAVEQQLQEHMAMLACTQAPVSERQALQQLLHNAERLINNLAAVGALQGVRRRRLTQQQQQEEQQQQQQQSPQELEQQLQQGLQLKLQPQSLTSSTAASTSKPVPVPKDEEYQLARAVVAAVLPLLPVQAYVPPGLVGFEEQLAILTAQLAVEDPSVLGLWLHGTGGMGKTTLATLLYNTLRSSFKHAAMVTLDLDGSTPEQLHGHLKTVCKSLGLPKGGAGPELLRCLADFMQENKVLLFLDNINHSTQLDGLLPVIFSSSGSRVIITSREAELQGSSAYKALVKKRAAGQPGPPVCRHKMAPLQDEPSKALFRAHHGFDEARLKAMQLCEIEAQLLKACSGLPLALRVLGGALSTDEEEEHVKQIWQEVQRFTDGRWTSTGHPDETRLMNDVVYHSFSKLSGAAQNMFLDTVSVLHGEAYDKAMLVWEAWWPDQAHSAFKRLQQLSLVSVVPPGHDGTRRRSVIAAPRTLLVLDVIKSLGQSIIRGRTEGHPGLVDVGCYYGSRIWMGPDGQAAGIVAGKTPVAINLTVCSPQQYALQGCDLSELRILITHDVAPNVWHQAPHLLWVISTRPVVTRYHWHADLPSVLDERCSCHQRHTASEDMRHHAPHRISRPLQELVLLELLEYNCFDAGARSHAGWQALLQCLCTAGELPAGLPALRRVKLDARIFEQRMDGNLEALISTVSRCSRLQHLYLCNAHAQVWGKVFSGLSAVECIQLVSCEFVFSES